MILTVTGCYGTGSSAVTDLIREFEGISCVSDSEIRILHDPDGVSDLEYSLIENPNRHNSSQSIKRFKKRMYELDHIWFVRRFSRYFGKGFLKAADRYVDELTVLNYHGTWHYDEYDRGRLFFILSRLLNKAELSASKKLKMPPHSWGLISKNEDAYLTITEEDAFLNATKRFVNNLCRLIQNGGTDFYFIDQFIPPSNFSRYLRYAPDIRAVLVERDPRDLYLMEKAVWGGGVAPTDSVKKYCQWYRWTRNLYEKTPLPEQVILIRFEDLIFNYEETKNRIIEHFGIQGLLHQKALQYFVPEKSVVNTQVWKKIQKYKREITYIEHELKQYCYDFEHAGIIRSEYKGRLF